MNFPKNNRSSLPAQTSKILAFGLFFFFLFLFLTLCAKDRPSVITAKAPSVEKPEFMFVAEFHKTAEKVVFTISEKQKSGQKVEETLEKTYGQLLQSFPAYTQFEVVISKQNLPSFEKIIPSEEIKNRITYHFQSNSGLEIEAWAQDYFEPALKNGETLFVLPAKIEAGSRRERLGEDISSRITTRNDLMADVFGLQQTKTAPFFFEGGNFQIAKTKTGELIALLDYANFHYSFSNDLDRKINSQEAADQISSFMQGTKIAIVGDRPRKANFIHLDQSLLFLPNGNVLANKITGLPQSSAAKQHQTYSKQLQELGFNVIHIKTSNQDVDTSRSSLNAIVFFDKEQDKYKVIFPVFENEIKNNSQQELSKEDLLGKALQTYTELERLDIEPIPLLDQLLFQNKAGFHCVVNVIK